MSYLSEQLQDSTSSTNIDSSNSSTKVEEEVNVKN